MTGRFWTTTSTRSAWPGPTGAGASCSPLYCYCVVQGGPGLLGPAVQLLQPVRGGQREPRQVRHWTLYPVLVHLCSLDRIYGRLVESAPARAAYLAHNRAGSPGPPCSDQVHQFTITSLPKQHKFIINILLCSGMTLFAVVFCKSQGSYFLLHM